MRRGKECSQASHASSMWLIERLAQNWVLPDEICDKFTQEEKLWLFEKGYPVIGCETKGKFTKICLQVDSEADLVAIYDKACQAKLNSQIVTDAGLTEFGGIPTKTCCAIGPNKSSEIDVITGNLKLY